ncbi:ash family protein [Salmonella enterica]|nr:ash family protein [Salmonella enterica]EJN4045246.1 ash family protein [Salmonella enterica]
MMLSYRQQKMCLIKMLTGCYFSPAATLLAVGNTTPLQLQATTSASCAFFIVVKTIFAKMRHFMAWCIGNGRTGGQHTARFMMHHSTMSMVALAGPTSVGPVSCNAGSGIPVRAIASEHTTSCDSMNSCYRRLPSWLRPQPKNTQNPRSATRTPFLNSATTVGARLSVSKSFRSGYTSTISVLLRWLPHILFMPFPTSTMILRM